MNRNDCPLGDANYPADVDRILALGWDEVVRRIRKLTQALIFVLRDVCQNRADEMSPEERARIKLLGCARMAREDLIYLLKGFEPICDETIGPQPIPSFDLGGGRRPALDDSEIISTMQRIESHWELLVECADGFATSPGTEDPTLVGLADLFIEMARFQNVERALLMAAAEHVLPFTSQASAVTDHFGVGAPIDEMVASLISARCLTFAATVSLPVDPDLDVVIATYLASRTLIRGTACRLFQGEHFNAGLTHVTNHLTISAGQPFHSPDRLCFDRRVGGSKVTNTELVLNHVRQLGAPIEFADGIVDLARVAVSEKRAGNFSLEMLTAIQKRASTMSLGLSAAELFLESRFPVSDEFIDWLVPPDRRFLFLKGMPGYPEFAAKPEPMLKAAAENQLQARQAQEQTNESDTEEGV